MLANKSNIAQNLLANKILKISGKMTYLSNLSIGAIRRNRTDD